MAMEFHGIEEFMRYLKVKFDESERKPDWRALTGRDHVSGVNDTFIFSEAKVYQIKSVEVSPGQMVAVAAEVGDRSPDMLELMDRGARVPLSVVSKSPDAYSVIMFGLQQYSSDAADLLRREYFYSKQDRLDSDLERRLKLMLERPEYRRGYRELRERQEVYFA
ncbi:MAG: hypothetical protein QXJ32_03970 [Thermoplasmata archaeon]